MNIIVLLIVLGVVFFATIIGIGYLILSRLDIKKRIHPNAVDDAEEKTKGWKSIQKGYKKLAKPLGELIPRPPEEMSKQERKLVQAGIRGKDSVKMLYGSKLLMAIVFLLLSISLGLIWINPLLCLMVSILLGFMIPDLWLNYAIAARTDKIQRALPNALDLAVVCIESGMGLDQALQRIGQEMKKGFKEMSDELNILGLEIRAGRTRTEALRNLANRTTSQDLKSLVAVLIQTDRFGTSVAQSLRVFADTMRTTRRLRAEEHAAKMTIKMIPPLVFFIFPVIMVILMGPAFITILRVLTKELVGS